MLKTILDLDTPSLLIEKSIVENNIFDMQELMNKQKINFRPHTKTHKMPYFAKLQLKAGASGITCAKTSEAEIMADSGIKDILIANIIIGGKKFDRLLKLKKRIKYLATCVDSIENAKLIGDFMQNHNTIFNVLIIVDVGYGRCGISNYDNLLDLAKFIQNHKNLNLKGILTHPGQAYTTTSQDEIKKIAFHESEFMVQTAKRLKSDEINFDTVSIGSNPTARFAGSVQGITELRTGNYIFNDMIQVTLGTVDISRCALSVLTQVISKPAKDRVILDIGSKALSSDRSDFLSGYGKIRGKNAIIEKLSEEHAIVRHKGESFSYGERLRVIPNHSCTTVNMFDTAYLIDGNKVIQELNISARGKMT